MLGDIEGLTLKLPRASLPETPTTETEWIILLRFLRGCVLNGRPAPLLRNTCTLRTTQIDRAIRLLFALGSNYDILLEVLLRFPAYGPDLAIEWLDRYRSNQASIPVDVLARALNHYPSLASIILSKCMMSFGQGAHLQDLLVLLPQLPHKIVIKSIKSFQRPAERVYWRLWCQVVSKCTEGECGELLAVLTQANAVLFEELASVAWAISSTILMLIMDALVPILRDEYITTLDAFLAFLESIFVRKADNEEEEEDFDVLLMDVITPSTVDPLFIKDKLYEPLLVLWKKGIASNELLAGCLTCMHKGGVSVPLLPPLTTAAVTIWELLPEGMLDMAQLNVARACLSSGRIDADTTLDAWLTVGVPLALKNPRLIRLFLDMGHLLPTEALRRLVLVSTDALLSVQLCCRHYQEGLLELICSLVTIGDEQVWAMARECIRCIGEPFVAVAPRIEVLLVAFYEALCPLSTVAHRLSCFLPDTRALYLALDMAQMATITGFDVPFDCIWAEAVKVATLPPMPRIVLPCWGKDHVAKIRPRIFATDAPTIFEVLFKMLAFWQPHCDVLSLVRDIVEANPQLLPMAHAAQLPVVDKRHPMHVLARRQ